MDAGLSMHEKEREMRDAIWCGGKELLGEIEHLQQMLNDAKEEKNIQAVARASLFITRHLAFVLYVNQMLHHGLVSKQKTCMLLMR